MLFNVPQYIDIEDKIVGPLTAKQLGWLGLGGVVLLVCWGLLDASAFIISAIVTSAVFGALAFYRPYNQPLIKFLTSSASFTARPKMYVWKRTPEEIRPIKKPVAPKNSQAPKKKDINTQKIEEISKLLDFGSKY